MGRLDRLVDEIESGQSEVRTEESGSSTPLVASSWVSIFSFISTVTKLHVRGLKIDISGGTPTALVARIVAGPTGGPLVKIFPSSASFTVVSSREETLRHELTIPKDYDYEVQVNCTATGGASATLSFLSITEINKAS